MVFSEKAEYEELFPLKNCLSDASCGNIEAILVFFCRITNTLQGWGTLQHPREASRSWRLRVPTSPHSCFFWDGNTKKNFDFVPFPSTESLSKEKSMKRKQVRENFAGNISRCS